MSSKIPELPTPEPEDDKNQTVHLRLDADLRADLETIAGWMRQDPELRRLRVNIGRQKALRYAVGICLAHPPEHARPPVGHGG